MALNLMPVQITIPEEPREVSRALTKELRRQTRKRFDSANTRLTSPTPWQPKELTSESSSKRLQWCSRDVLFRGRGTGASLFG